MKKLEAWPVLLTNYIKAVRRKPFAWGTFDCCMFAADGVEAMTGEDFAADFRGKYHDAPSAYAALARYAGGGILPTMEILAEQFGWKAIDNPRKVQRGDIVMGNPDVVVTDERFDGSLGLCCGTISVFIGPKELVAVSTIENDGAPPTIIHAWRIKTARD